MHITRLTAENVKRIRAVRITPDGAVIRITGRNAQGKSSVLDAIQYALGGERVAPPEVIRRGEKEARVVLETDKYKITREWWKDEEGQTRSELRLESRQGAKFPSPQSMLNDALGGKGILNFDPLSFANLKPRDQLETLRRITALDFADLDAGRARSFADRTDYTRDLKALEAQLAEIPDQPAPPAEVPLRALINELRVAEGHNAAIREQESAVKTAYQLARQAQAEVESLQARLATAQRSLADAEQLLDSRQKALDNMKPIDTDPIQKRVVDMEETNRRVGWRNARRQKQAAIDATRDNVAALTAQIDAIDRNKARMLSEVKMPVEGLGFGEDGVTFNGLPFEQASQAERLRVSLAIGLSLSPAFKVLLIREGSLLDSASLALVAEAAEKAGAQVWIEQVTDGENLGVVIEDGAVKEPEPDEVILPGPVVRSEPRDPDEVRSEDSRP